MEERNEMVVIEEVNTEEVENVTEDNSNGEILGTILVFVAGAATYAVGKLAYKGVKKGIKWVREKFSKKNEEQELINDEDEFFFGDDESDSKENEEN